MVIYLGYKDLVLMPLQLVLSIYLFIVNCVFFSLPHYCEICTHLLHWHLKKKKNLLRMMSES